MSTIRLARAPDLAAVEALVDAAYSHYVARIGMTPGPMRDDYRPYIAAGYVNLLFEGGKEDGGNGGDRGSEVPVGLLVLIPKPDTLLLDNVAVSPVAQGRGYGKRLMQMAETYARDHGFDSITLYTQEQMHENLAIYRRYGYVETHRAEERGLKRVYLRKSL